jgi:Fe-Mn family superoxide dismutase
VVALHQKEILMQRLTAPSGIFQTFYEQLTNAGMTRFGSGWAWLIVNGEKKLQVVSTPNQAILLWTLLR